MWIRDREEVRGEYEGRKEGGVNWCQFRFQVSMALVALSLIHIRRCRRIERVRSRWQPVREKNKMRSRSRRRCDYVLPKQRQERDHVDLQC